MGRGEGEPVAGPGFVIWQAKPTARSVLQDLLVALLASGFIVALVLIVPHADPWTGWLGMLPPVLSVVRSLVTSMRGRVVLRPDGVEVRRILTRYYPWASLLSVTIEEDGRIEITPKGWVRKLPIPLSEAPEAFKTIIEWRAAARAGAGSRPG